MQEDKIEAIIEDLKSYDPEKIILFGSVAKGISDAFSDIDMVIIKNTNKRFIERLVEASRLIRKELQPVDLFIYTPGEIKLMKEEGNSFIEEALKNGRIVYERSHRNS